MSFITVIAALALAAMLVWKIGAPVARIGGALMVIGSLVSIVLGDPATSRLTVLAAGAALWLAGHFLGAYKNRVWRSRLAEAIVTHTPLRYIDPVNGRRRRPARRTTSGKATTSRRNRPTAKVSGRVDDFAEWERELAPAPADRAAATRTPERPAHPSRGAVYGKRAVKVASNVAVRRIPGARAARSTWRFLR